MVNTIKASISDRSAPWLLAVGTDSGGLTQTWEDNRCRYFGRNLVPAIPLSVGYPSRWRNIVRVDEQPPPNIKTEVASLALPG